ncbi:MAG: trypsin-like peptidase domain-containing protein [Methylotenera sp.]|uniref:S1 family peptidase n=1 Tax=Methylotenera sp. TaxID=2051956 RepID=UPI002486FF09|nr:serine protease [Methylotenera sp.]MDI1309880.1 trypsin-like peptidase domain-containing protein [Methylotenera sp.]
MTRLMFALLYMCGATNSWAMPTDELVQNISEHVVKVQVGLANGGYGLGSGVVIAKDQVVTNCHVVANATSVTINAKGENYSASALKPDWHHDLCILKVEGLNLPIANIGSSQNLKYEQPVYSVGFAGFSPRANATSGFVKGLYPMDDSVVVRASNTFRLGDSGGGVFDESGNLVAIITVKSPGHNAFYYNMSVEWVKELLNQPEQSIVGVSELPFWAESEDKWPFFMRIVQPFKTENWEILNKIASAWYEKEPNTSEALFYRAVAEFSLKNEARAEQYFNQVVARNGNNSSAIYYLGLIAENTGKHMEALNLVAMLDNLDQTTAGELKVAMGIDEN